MARITMLIQKLKGGGAERSVFRTAGGLAERGHDVDIVLFSPTFVYPGELPRTARLIVLCGRFGWMRRARSDVPQGTLWRPWLASPFRLAGFAADLVREFRTAARVLMRPASLGHALRLARYFERERPDIVFANLASAEYAAFFAARLVSSPPPIVPILRGADEPGAKSTRRRRLLFPTAARLVAVSRGVSENIAAIVDVPPEVGIVTIYNPAFAPEIARHAEAAPDHPWFRDGGPPVVLGVGRLTPQKDFPTLVEAFRRVTAEHPCRLLILGEGFGRAELESRIRALGLEDRVSLPGWADNPWAFMARAALFVLSSRYEGLSNVLVEALTCGCPAVSTDCAGSLEILEDPDLLAPMGDPERLAKAMLRALAHPADRSTLRGRAARFSLERTVDGYDKLIAAVLARAKVKTPGAGSAASPHSQSSSR